MKILRHASVFSAMSAVIAALALANAPRLPLQNDGPPPIEGRVKTILESMNAFLTERDQFRFEAHVTYDRPAPSGQLLETHEVHDVAVQRPGSLRATVLGQDGARVAFAHDGTLTIADPLRAKFFQAEVPEQLDEVVDVMIVDLGLALPNADFVSNDPMRSLTSSVTRSEYVGIAMVDGEPCHHLAFAQEELEWQLWVSAELQPVPRRLSMHYIDQPSSPRFTASLQWMFDEARYPELAFGFTPSERMTRVETIDAILGKETK